MNRPRKKWRLQKFPAFTYRVYPSKWQAYAEVSSVRELYSLGLSPTHGFNVEVDEGAGNGWQLYERIIFPPRFEATA